MVPRFQVIHFNEYNGELKDKIEGQRVVLLMDEHDTERGSLVWRLASGHTVEITEFGIHTGEDHRQGWGTLLLNESLKDMHRFFENNPNYPKPLRRIFLFTEASNTGARAFYRARGFYEEVVLKDFYDDGDAVMCIMNV
jgi:ribosomal protein S18 acetylase RimI-like enzyme